ncbi:MAG TPA: YceH family protein [Casimicrobiaceae bacterium]|nr:YceH family protein [Casimicrobiaceae bacterium]
MALPVLSLLETRVLGVLIEKQHTVPDGYPMTLNAITAGCNQKTSRDPVISVTEGEVQSTLDRLKLLSLVVESSGGRVMRYAHNAERVLAIPSQAVALIAVLMLRGAQTAAELRINSERLHRFADASAVEGFLRELAQRSAGALVMELPRQPGTRETRWMHLLSGAPEAPAAAETVAGDDPVAHSEITALKANVRELQAEVSALRATVAKLCAELGVPPPAG